MCDCFRNGDVRELRRILGRESIGADEEDISDMNGLAKIRKKWSEWSYEKEGG